MTVLFLARDIHAVGGIQRYSRYEVRALEEILGAGSVDVSSMYGSDGEMLPAIAVAGRGGSTLSKARFALATIRHAWRRRPTVVIASHVNLAPLAQVAAWLIGSPYWVNVYAIEVWGPLRFLRRRALTSADLVVSDCDFTRALLFERYPVLRGKIEVVADCVDVEQFSPAPEIAKNGRPKTLLTVSRLQPGRSKGHDRVFEALSQLKRDGLRFSYVVGGDGDDRGRLEGRARELGIADEVVFLGRIPDEQLPSVYREADVFALVSGFSLDPSHPLGEGVPLVVLEAQACGRPAITSSRDGSRESIADGRTGILVDPDDVGAIATAVRMLITDDGLRKTFGEQAATFAREQFSYPVFRDRLRQLLERRQLA